jgi:hypothetical protein
MKKNYLLILLIFLFGCSNVTNQHSNQISEKVLDSLMTASKEIPLTKYQSQDSQIKTALLILKEKLHKSNMNLSKLLVGNVAKKNDSIITFEISDVDELISNHYRNRVNKELKEHPDKDGSYISFPPITGQISGVEGTYSVNTKNKTLRIYLSQ